jgi:tryptophan-rich sensory protein
VRAGQLVAVGVVLTVIGYAGLATRWVSSDPGWYARLVKPAWQPPDWVFGVAWPYNFLALLVAGVAIGLNRPVRVSLPWLGLLVASSVAALIWAYLFYVPHSLAAAAGSLAVAAVLAWALAIVALRTMPWAGLVVLPYALWLSVATSLAVQFARTA